MTHGTRHAARQTWVVMYPNPVPAQETQSYGMPCRFQRDTYDEESTPTFERTEYKTTPHTKLPGNRFIYSRRKKHFERTPRATQCTDRAQTSTTVSRWPSFVDLLRVCANGLLTKRYNPCIFAPALSVCCGPPTIAMAAWIANMSKHADVRERFDSFSKTVLRIFLVIPLTM